MSRKVMTEIADKLTAKGVVLQAKNGSVLSVLDTFSLLDEYEAEGVDKNIATVIAKEIDFIKNVVIEFIKEYKKQTDDMIMSKAERKPVFPYKIVHAEIPEYVTLLVDDGRILMNRPNTLQLDSRVMKLQYPGPEIVREYINNGLTGGVAASFQNEIIFDDNDLADIWNKYLTNIASNNPEYINIRYADRHDIAGFDLFLLYPIVRGMIDNPPPRSMISLDRYNTVTTALLHLLEWHLAVYSKKVLTSKQPVLSILNKKVVVNKEALTNVLTVKGITIESLLGAIMSEPGFLSLNQVKSLEDNAKRYKGAWDKWSIGETITIRTSLVSEYKDAYCIIANKLTESRENDYSPMFDIPRENLNGLEYKIRKLLATLPDGDIIDYNTNITVHEKIVTELLFTNVRAKGVIESIKFYKANNTDISTKEAAKYAAMDYIVDYLISTIMIGKGR